MIENTRRTFGAYFCLLVGRLLMFRAQNNEPAHIITVGHCGDYWMPPRKRGLRNLKVDLEDSFSQIQ